MKTKTPTKKVVLVIPPVQKYTIRYQKANGDISDYEISPPIEKTNDSFTCYAFGRGVRTFKIDQVLDIR